eukprot:CAMPEP_0113847590 /NCGR_PEP_ID=MMETSP0372-20130328/1964_1 /TAXON_ID=340204 /ORGANISM="Lankesteria abbotti" /LENGTH=944 /DNA_ID=CAMNT_0000816895 /DNA_START=34 /DNA_END=2865 /DNA_ORIENTATION=- /assembly_acc=CAM_ASM_000359
MPLLVVEKSGCIIFRSFRSPLEGHVPGQTDESKRRTLGARVKRGGIYNQRLPLAMFKSPPKVDPADGGNDPPPNPLILWKDSENGGVIEVDSMLTKWLRQHQREGVQFMFDCLMGLRTYTKCGSSDDKIEGFGCILADDMGLGKTLQSISLMWTLLKQGFDGKTTVRKAIVVCPSSLVKNWAAEIDKWLLGRCPCTAVAETSKDKVVSQFEGFKYDRSSLVIISSYETFRLHVDRLDGCPIDLVICDEAHRLKNDKTKTAVAIANMTAKRRLLLSGTPIQNDLDEFFALVSICNPAVLGDATVFRKHFANPILVGREPDASERQQNVAGERLAELSNITNLFILRRTNNLLAKVLPPKLVMNIFCTFTAVQRQLYMSFLRSSACRKILQSSKHTDGASVTGKVLSAIQTLMKLCNHPHLIRSPDGSWPPGIAEDDNCTELLQSLAIPTTAKSSEIGRGTRSGGRVGHTQPELSAKCLLLLRMLREIRRTSRDRVVLISNYTQTLDLFERICKENAFPVVRLDGSTTIKKRHEMVVTFNEPTSMSFVFLLSSKAGGCGINLIGANRLVMFDPDWNPANDKQALARVWRDGQKKQCYIYRLFSAGSIEEKIYQRQICKDGLSTMIVGEDAALKDSLRSDMVKDLFTFRTNTTSETHDMLACKRCIQLIDNDDDVSIETPDVTNNHDVDIDLSSSALVSSGMLSTGKKSQNFNHVASEMRGGSPVFEVSDDDDDNDRSLKSVPRCNGKRKHKSGASRTLPFVPQMDGSEFNEDDLLTWAHHHDLQTVADPVLVTAATEEQSPLVSFVMSCLIDFSEDTIADTTTTTTTTTTNENKNNNNCETDIKNNNDCKIDAKNNNNCKIDAKNNNNDAKNNNDCKIDAKNNNNCKIDAKNNNNDAKNNNNCKIDAKNNNIDEENEQKLTNSVRCTRLSSRSNVSPQTTTNEKQP